MVERIELLEEKKLENEKAILRKSRIFYQTGGYRNTSEIILPHVSDEELLNRFQKIRPIVKYKDWLYYYKTDTNIEELRNVEYMWDPKNDIRELVNIEYFEELGVFPCYHTYGYYGIFKPTIAEVLEQFPDEYLEQATAFYMVDYPKNDIDLNKQLEIVNSGCHESRVSALRLRK